MHKVRPTVGASTIESREGQRRKPYPWPQCTVAIFALEYRSSRLFFGISQSRFSPNPRGQYPIDAEKGMMLC